MSSEHDSRRAAFIATMQRLGLTAFQWAQRAGVPPNTLYSFINGQTASLRGVTEKKLAMAAGISVDALYGEDHGAPDKPVWVIGYAGAGGAIELQTVFGRHEGIYEAARPPGLGPDEDLAAFEIRGLSMPPAGDRWVIYVRRRERADLDEVNGRACVVETADGELLFKTVRRGYEPGTFNLESWNGAAPIENVRLRRAQPVVAIVTPEAARRV